MAQRTEVSFGVKTTTFSVRFYSMYNMEFLTSVLQKMCIIISFGVPWDCLHSLHYKLSQGNEDDIVFAVMTIDCCSVTHSSRGQQSVSRAMDLLGPLLGHFLGQYMWGHAVSQRHTCSTQAVGRFQQRVCSSM